MRMKQKYSKSLSMCVVPPSKSSSGFGVHPAPQSDFLS